MIPFDDGNPAGNGIDGFIYFLNFRNMSIKNDVQEKFVLHWGEMGTRWGINRTVAQTHALIHVSERPLNAEEICESLEIARSNASTSLKELLSWGIIRIVHLKGDRRDHYESVKDVWELFRIVAAERKKRELDPTLAILDECLAAPVSPGESPVFRERLTALREFMRAAAATHDAMQKLPPAALARLGTSIDTLAGFAGLGR